jgi:hypothetical protein
VQGNSWTLAYHVSCILARILENRNGGTEGARARRLYFFSSRRCGGFAMGSDQKRAEAQRRKKLT